MNHVDIQHAASDIATRIFREVRLGRLKRVDFDSIRCAVAGYLIGSSEIPTVRQIEELENLALRKFVEACP